MSAQFIVIRRIYFVKYAVNRETAIKQTDWKHFINQITVG